MFVSADRFMDERPQLYSVLVSGALSVFTKILALFGAGHCRGLLCYPSICDNHMAPPSIQCSNHKHCSCPLCPYRRVRLYYHTILTTILAKPSFLFVFSLHFRRGTRGGSGVETIGDLILSKRKVRLAHKTTL